MTMEKKKVTSADRSILNSHFKYQSTIENVERIIFININNRLNRHSNGVSIQQMYATLTHLHTHTPSASPVPVGNGQHLNVYCAEIDGLCANVYQI